MLTDDAPYLRNHFHRELDKYFSVLASLDDLSDRPSFSDYYEHFVFTPPPRIPGPRLSNCAADNCVTKAVKGRNLCHKHRMRQHKQRNPLSYVYSKIKYNAKYRGKEFTLTRRFFYLFCWYHNYDVYKGKRNNNYQIGRIENDKGYHRGNIQILTARENRAKYHHTDKVKEDLPF